MRSVLGLGLALAPLRGVLQVVDLIHDRVAQELESEENLRRRLVTLRLQLEMDEIEPAEYAAAEAHLLERLRAVRRAKWAEWGGEQHGGADPDR